MRVKQTKVLVATDIAARGIDIDELSHVINFDIPNIPETYIHRIGRTGRAGLDGVAISLCDSEEVPYLKEINKLLSKPIPIIENNQYVLKPSVETMLKKSVDKKETPKVEPKKRSKFNTSKSNSWKRKSYKGRSKKR